jgi:multimeric flavodoxin WrbA
MKEVFSIEHLLKTADSRGFEGRFHRTLEHLARHRRVLLVTTSNRYQPEGKPRDIPKSTQIALALARRLLHPPTVVHADKLRIYSCEGNISRHDGNGCGVPEALLPDRERCPTRKHRCWASINNPDDELWKVTKPLFESDAVVFIGSVRWGSANAVYQKLIERLSWIENAHVTLGEANPVEGIEAGFICTGHNWRGADVVDLQRSVLGHFGFKTPAPLFWNWQWINDSDEESEEGYLQDAKDFRRIINLTVEGLPPRRDDRQ